MAKKRSQVLPGGLLHAIQHTIGIDQGFGHSRFRNYTSFVSRFHPWSSRGTPTLAQIAALFLVIIHTFGLSALSQQQPLGTSFYFTSFNSSSSNSLTYLGDAFVANEQVYLTSEQVSTPTETIIVPLSHGIGRVLHATPIRGRDPLTAGPVSFSTTFIFSIVNPQQLQLGDGLAFLLTANRSTVGSGGGYLGVLSQVSNGAPSSNTFAVEFDTWQNPTLLDPDSNHVGVDVDSMISLQTSTAGFWDDGGVFNGVQLTGQPIQAWVDYSSQGRVVEVRVSPVIGSKPARPLMALVVDLSQVVEEDEMFIGFAAATGDLSAEHVIHAWSFSSGGQPARDFQDLSPSELSPHKQEQEQQQHLIIRWITIGAASLILVLIGLTVFAICRMYRRSRRGGIGGSSSKVHVGDPEALVLPADSVRDAARAQATLNISKVLAEAHMRAFTEGR